MDRPTERYITHSHWMWVMHAGDTHPCEVCGERTTTKLWEGSEELGQFCRQHAPTDVPLYDPTACGICDRPSTCVTDDGWRCDDHRMTPDFGLSSTGDTQS